MVKKELRKESMSCREALSKKRKNGKVTVRIGNHILVLSENKQKERNGMINNKMQLNANEYIEYSFKVRGGKMG